MSNSSILKIVVLSFLLSSCAIGPSSLIRQHAYDGPKKPAAEVATVYAKWGGLGGGMMFICGVDGKGYSQLGAISPCPSVVYLTPGQHTLNADWRFANRIANKELIGDFKAGKVYEVIAKHADIPLAQLTDVELILVEKSDNYQLTYKELAPAFFVKGDVSDSKVDPATGK